MKQILFLILTAFFLMSCSTADTTGDITDRDYDLTVTNHGSGNITMYFPATITASTDTDTDQITDNDPSNTVSPKLAVGLEGATSTATDAGTLEGITSAAKRLLDNSNVNSHNPVDNSKDSTENITQEIIPPETVSESVVSELVVSEPISGKATIDVEKVNAFQNKSFVWLLNTGSHYGKNVRFVFNNGCGEFTVPDGSVTHGEDGNSKNYNQRFYFSGTDFPVGSAENLNNRASVFTAPGCVASSVDVHYNK